MTRNLAQPPSPLNSLEKEYVRFWDYDDVWERLRITIFQALRQVAGFHETSYEWMPLGHTTDQWIPICYIVRKLLNDEDHVPLMTTLPFYLVAGFTASFRNHIDTASQQSPGQVTRTPNKTDCNLRAPRIIIIIIIMRTSELGTARVTMVPSI